MSRFQEGNNVRNYEISYANFDSSDCHLKVEEEEQVQPACKPLVLRTSSGTVFDADKLIYEIRSRECLWNPVERMYSDKLAKLKAWEEIADSFYPGDWLTYDEKQEKVEELQKKWKSIRDYYTRERKRDKEGVPSKKKKPSYFELLSFLNSVIREPRHSTESNIILADDSVEGPTAQSDGNIESLLEISLDVKDTPLPPVASPSPAAGKRKMVPYQDDPAFVEYARSLDSAVDEDPNRHFLLSLLPEMRSMGEQQNFEFRMEIMKALNKVKYKIPNIDRD